MRWPKKFTGRYVKSNCGYRISLQVVDGGRVYTAWAPGEWYVWNFIPIGYFKNSEGLGQAVAACDNHYSDAGVIDGGSGEAQESGAVNGKGDAGASAGNAREFSLQAGKMG